MRTYLVDATNAARRAGHAPGFDAMEDLRTRELVDRVARHVLAFAGRVAVELFFDGPRRDVGSAPGVLLRFSGERSADELILGTVRSLRAQGKGVIVATEDYRLREEVLEEGGRAIGFGELFGRFRDGKA